MKARRATTSFLLLFLCIPVFSQKTSFHLDTALFFYNIPIEQAHVSTSVCTKVKGDTFFVAFIAKNEFILYEYNHPNRKLKKSTYKLKQKNHAPQNLNDFIVTKNFVYLLYAETVYCLSVAKKKELFAFNCGLAEHLFLDQKYLYAGFYYNYHPNSSRHKAGLRKFDLLGNLIDSIFLSVPFPEYTNYIPKNLISFNQKQFVFPLFNGMNFLFVDTGFEKIDTLFLPVEKFDSNWVYPSKSLSKSFADNFNDPSLFWGLLDNSNYNKISRIEFVEFIDSATIFVRWFKYHSDVNRSVRYTTYLVKKSGVWQPLNTELNAETPKKFNTDLNIFAGGMPLLSQNHTTEYSKNYIFQVKIDIEFLEPLPYKEYYKKKKEKEKTLTPVISLWIFKYD